MKENPSYNAQPGHRWGTGSASVLRYLLADLAQKPAVTQPALPVRRTGAAAVAR